jgi:hypothetical protein
MLCVNADFNKTEAIQDLIINLEMLALESFTEVVGNIVWDETHYQTAESLTDEERAWWK